MQSSKRMKIVAWCIAAPMFLFLLMAGGTKVAGMNPLAQLEAMTSYVFWVGLGELTAALLFLIPQTTVIGGLFLSAHLGGAILFHIIRAEPFIGPVLTSFWFQSLMLAACWTVVFLRRPDILFR